MNRPSQSVAVFLLLALAVLPGSTLSAEPRFSVFAWQVVDHAKRTGLSVRAAAEAFRAVGVEGFDCHYGDTNVAELVKGGLSPVNFFGGLKFLAPDGGVAQTEDFVAAALRHKVPRVMVLPDEFTGKDDEADFAKIVDGLRMFVRRAKERGLVATTEDFGYYREHQNPCGHVAYLKRILESVPDLMFTVDSGNLHVLEGRDAVLEIMRTAAGRIRHVHLKDCAASAEPGKRGPWVTLGTGEVPNREIVRFVCGLGYPGWYTLENLTGDDLVEDAVRQIATIRHWASAALVPKSSDVKETELWSSEWTEVTMQNGVLDDYYPRKAEAAGCSFRFRIMRYAEAIGVEAYVRDDHVVVDDCQPGQISCPTWKDDCLEVFFDGDNDRNPNTRGPDYNTAPWPCNAGGEYAVCPNGASQSDYASARKCFGTLWGGTIEPWLERGRRIGTHYRLRFRYECLNRPVPRLDEAVRFGFTICIHDDDDGGENDYALYWKGNPKYPFADESAFGQIVMPPVTPRERGVTSDPKECIK